MENKKNSQLKKVTFFADVMLGRLAKWLRILGYDTAYSSNIHHEKLASLAKKEGRMVLTRSRKITKLLLPSEYIFIEGNFVVEQLKQVVRELSLDIAGNPVTFPLSSPIPCDPAWHHCSSQTGGLKDGKARTAGIPGSV